MSTILKALQRLEDEKSANSERSLDEQIVAHRPPPDPERRGLKIAAVAIGGLAVVAAAFLFWSTREDPDAEVAMESSPPAAAPAAETKQEVAAAKPRRKRSARPAPAAPAQPDSSEVEVSPVVEVVEHLDALPAESGAGAASPKSAASGAEAGAERPSRRPRARRSNRQVAREAAEPDPALKQIANAEPPPTEVSGNSASAKRVQAPPATVEAAAVAPKPAPPPAPVEVAEAVPKPAPPPPAPVEVAAVVPKPAPPVASSSIPAPIREPEQKVVQRAKLPTFSIEKTVWHPDAERRVAVVKLVDTREVLRLKEGDAIGPLVVKSINPGSVLFDHDGIEVVYNVGS